ncbi:TonB-dependent receptor [bacterium]|nr:TonB-dependent receptor [bacterium]
MLQKTFRRYASIAGSAVLFVCMLVTVASAQLSTGKIEGTVRDNDSGQPLVGAQVLVDGTRLGNVTNNDGYYFILNVPPGRRSITFTYTGYQKTTIADQLILAGQTTTINSALSSSVVELNGITVEGESEILLPRDQTVSKQRLTSSDLHETPLTNLDQAMTLQAGVQIGGQDAESRGLRIRGGRLGEEGMVVDGVMVRNYTANPFSTGTGWIFNTEVGSTSTDATPLELSTSAVEEVDIITGGFQAEFGNAQSGIINIVTKEGGPDFKGVFNYTTDEINPRTSDWGYNQMTADIGGPVKIVPNLFFHGSGEIQGFADNFATHADEGFRGINQTFVDRLNGSVRNDPVLGGESNPYTLDMFRTGREFYASKAGADASLFSPSNPVRLPGNWADRTLISGKVTYAPVSGVKTFVSENWSRSQDSNPQGWSADGDYFQNGIINRNAYNFDYLYGNTWDQSPWFNGILGSGDEILIHTSNARRTRMNTLMFGLDWDFLRSANRSATLQIRYLDVASQDITNANPKTNWQRDTFMSWSAHDVQFEVETWPGRDGLNTKDLRAQLLPDGLVTWRNNTPYETPLDVERTSLYYMNYQYLREDQNNFKMDLDFQINRMNRAKLGFQSIDLKNHRFRQSVSTDRRNPINEFRYKPSMYAAYIQNRTDLGDFVFDYGLRYDTFQHNTNWGITSLDQYGDYVRPRTLYEWSPRFDVAFPVTDKSQLRFSYGVFTQLPSMEMMFSSSNPGGLEYSRTDSYETGLSYLVTNDLLFDVVAYYRDVDGNLSNKSFFEDYNAWHLGYEIRDWTQGYVNRDNGNIKGVDFSLRKRFSNNYSINMQYTLQFSRTTGSAYNKSSFVGNYDPSSNQIYVPPDFLAPISGDRTHKLTCQFNYLFPEDYRSGTLANTVLGNVRVYSVLQLQSGQPLVANGGPNDMAYGYAGQEDPSAITYSGLHGLNAFRGRWDLNLDLRVSKTFRLGGTRNLSVFSEIFNVLNHRNNHSYPSNYHLDDYSSVTGGVDLKWEDLSETDFNRTRFNADFNGDGILTVKEAAMGAIASDFIQQTMDKRLWGMARQIRTGLEFSF